VQAQNLPKRPSLIVIGLPQLGQVLDSVGATGAVFNGRVFLHSGKAEQAKKRPLRLHLMTIGAPQISHFSLVFSWSPVLISRRWAWSSSSDL